MRSEAEAIAAEAVRVHGAQQKEAELAEFLATLQDMRPEVVVEIGSYAGGTLYAWRQIAATVIGIDIPGPAFYGCLDGGQRREHGATMLYGDSHQAETVERLKTLLAGKPIDCLFIDGDHSYEGVRQDYLMYSPLVRAGGIVGFHDIVEHSEQPGIEVDRFWRSIKDDRAVEIIRGEGNWGGIGVALLPSVVPAKRRKVSHG